MSQINLNPPADDAAGDDPQSQGNGLIKLHTSGPASDLSRKDFVSTAWRLEIRAARLMAVPFELFSDGRWRQGQAGDYVVFGARGEVAIVAGLNFPQLCRVE